MDSDSALLESVSSSMCSLGSGVFSCLASSVASTLCKAAWNLRLLLLTSSLWRLRSIALRAFSSRRVALPS